MSDALPVYGVPDSAVAALGFGQIEAVARETFFSVQELPEAVSVEELKRRVEQCLEFSHCRIFGAKEKSICRFAFLIGGFGENQRHMPQVAMELGAEVVITGEINEMLVLSALEIGLPVIESLHSISEIPGIKNQAALLAKELPDLRVEYVPSGAMSFT